MRRRLGLGHLMFLATALVFAVWSWLALGTTAFAGWDAASASPGVDPASGWGQILAAIAVVTTPVVQYVGLAMAAWWASRRRLHNLAWAMGLSIPVAWGGTQLAKFAFQRLRPPTAAPLITAEGFSYPSSHMVAITVLAVMVTAALVLTRQRRALLWLALAGIAAVWWFVLYDRWALRAHWFSDLIAGGLLGGALASACLVLAGVRVVKLPELNRVPTRDSGPPRRAAIIFNPTKVPDPVVFRRHVEGECSERGWQPPLWLETTVDDPGAGMTRRAIRKEVDLLFVAGGDGTVRAVCAAAAGSGTAIAILPVGTGNLLARNLGVPLDLADALDVAFEGRARAIDLVEIRADDAPAEASAVMAGMGADAAIMNETNEDLKKVVGPAAYVMAAMTSAKEPFRARLTVDDGGQIECNPAVVLVANVGQIQGAIDLAPDAAPDDGRLDVLIASPRTAGDWAAITTSVLTRTADAPGIERAQGRSVVIETDEPVPYQLDGDGIGTCRRLEATVLPAAVRLMVP